jgi:hypothetical protein
MQGNLAHHHFSCLAELRRDGGLIGQVLSRYPDLIRPADSDAEWQFGYQQKHQDPKRLPLPDPWQFLLGSPAVTELDKAVFRAAQSQLKALRRLGAIARDEATLTTDWNEKLESAKSPKSIRHTLNKLSAARARYDLFRAQAQNANDPTYREWVTQRVEQARRERIKRGEGNEAARVWPVPRLIEARNGFKLLSKLVEWWVSGPNEAPGLMFFRNEARTAFLKDWLPDNNLTSAAVKKDYQRLKLVPAGAKNHFVWSYSAKPRSNGDWRSVGLQRDGKLAFEGTLKVKQVSRKLA